MTKVDYKELCKELSCLNQVVVLDGNDQYGRPLFGIVPVLEACHVNMNGYPYWGLVCVSFTTQEVKWYSYNDIVGWIGGGLAQLDGLDRCLSVRYRWMDRTEAADTREAVQLMMEDLAQ